MMSWLLSHWPAVVAAIAVLVGGAKLWLSRWRVQRALEATRGERDRAELERDNAEASAAAATEAIERRERHANTSREVSDAADAAVAAHPENPDAAGAAADEYARRRHAELRAHADADRDGAVDPVPRDPATRPAARGRQ